MNKRHQIRLDQLEVGRPIAVDVYDASHRLLLRHGNVISSDSQLRRLVHEGLFSDTPLQSLDVNRAPSPAASGQCAGYSASALADSFAPDPKARISVYASAVAAAGKLEALLRRPEANPAFVAEIEDLARGVQRDCALDADAALAHIMFARDVPYPARQQINVAIVTAVLLERAHNDRERTHAAVCAALTMNLTIQPLQEALYHQPKMTAEQSEEITGHPTAARRLLEALGVDNETWLTIVEQHHESIDGSGYPHHLVGRDIAPEALVIGLADRYCAAVTERGYRQAVPPDAAIGFMRNNRGAAVDQTLLSELVHWIGMYPPGTVVELANRDIAIVTRRLEDPRHPVVYAVSPRNLYPFSVPRKRLTGRHAQFQIACVLPRTTIDFRIDPEILWPGTR